MFIWGYLLCPGLLKGNYITEKVYPSMGDNLQNHTPGMVSKPASSPAIVTAYVTVAKVRSDKTGEEKSSAPGGRREMPREEGQTEQRGPVGSRKAQKERSPRQPRRSLSDVRGTAKFPHVQLPSFQLSEY